MNDKLERKVAAASRDAALVDKLDRILAGPNDRAFLVCVYRDCVHNDKEECSIYTVLDVPQMKPGAPCDRFQTNNSKNEGDDKGEDG